MTEPDAPDTDDLPEDDDFEVLPAAPDAEKIDGRPAGQGVE